MNPTKEVEVRSFYYCRMFMNPKTGSVDTYPGWRYINERGVDVNAVDLGEVVEVQRNNDGDWIAVN